MRHRLITTRPPQWRRTLCAAGVAGLVLAATVGPIVQQSAGADSAPAYTATKELTRTFVNPDRTTTTAEDLKKVTVTVSQTDNLHNLQPITVSWTGAHPTGGVYANINGTDAVSQEYPVAIFECRGTDAAGTLDRSTCWTHGVNSRFQNWLSSAYAPWMLDRYASPAERAQHVNQPTNLKPLCAPTSNEFDRYQPFVAADGTSYSYAGQSCLDLPPEDYNDENPAIVIPSNATFAATDTQGVGSTKFAPWTDQQNASLGCNAQVACSLVVIPIMGISCDLSAVPAPDQAQAAIDCETTGRYAPGEHFNNPGLPAVSGASWWSASNWDQRFSVPLTFAPTGSACTNSAAPALPIYGSELMIEATNQWAPKFCQDPSLFKFTHVQTGEPLARSTLGQLGGPEAAMTSYSPAGGFSSPTVQAPIAVSGFAISYTIDGPDQQPYHSLRLTPRLLAKLMTESYPSSGSLKQAYPYLSGNPLSMVSDPEFQALNPGLTLSSNYPSMATLLQLSGNSDVTYALTSYILADPEARDWLDGQADPWGMRVNPLYLGIALPTFAWPLRDNAIVKSGDPACQMPVPFLPAVAAPVASLVLSAQSVQFANSTSKVNCDSDSQPTQFKPSGRQTPGGRFVIGLTSLSGASEYGLDQASLQSSASVADEQAPFTDSTGRTFVAPSAASLGAAAATLQQDSSTGTFPVDYVGLRLVPAAYPGTMVVYADVPTSGLPATDAINLSKFLLYAAGAGQQVGVNFGTLPAGGYYPMTTANGLGAMVKATVADAAAVAAQGSPPAASPPAAPATTAAPTPVAATLQDTGISVAAPTPSAAAQPSATAAAHSSAPVKLASPGMIPVANSSLAGVALPVLLGAALLGGLGSGAIRFWSRRPWGTR